jgi:hypothetical protein
MWSHRARKEFKATQARDALLARAKAGAMAGEDSIVFDSVALLRDKNHMKNDGAVLRGLSDVLDIMAQRNQGGALHLCMYTMDHANNEPELARAIARKGLGLAAGADTSDASAMSNVAALADRCVGVLPPGADRDGAVRQWQAAVDTLAGPHRNLAIAACCNAGIPGPADNPLKPIAIARWEKIITELAKTDPAEAKKQAEFIAHNFANFGEDAAEFRRRAADKLANPLQQKASDILFKFKL